MKWLTASNGIPLSILGLFLSLAALASSEGKKKPTLADAQLQMGFYDLLSQQKEIYDARVTATQGGVISTITSPNDNRFIFKGKFTEQTTQNGQLSFSYSPIFFNNPTSGRMIEGFLDYLMHNTVFMTPMVVEGQPLLVGQSGIVLGEK
ncbi:Uncharacterised protein [Yersinia pseudotuberculosis]|uniref:hypothetical protein n=1 Tax=Yersinia pseudotuberculosis TaxID=633 RepID=UPI0005AD3AFD|nr:hypothetical protein [Yersinia pseudotuberculosis]AJK16891.1 hypothetical protein BZ19_2733 [Yersinia pseudotuberculosis str. PA3606]CNK65156.1 Uncharacterised protein [Yersinia pseudotuberculosis]CNL80064.1 Uncharacterised protein [Yersinia pseudotuberculosis]CRY71223.1 Uncharacterised protein [Yersinia pseudotuberculosis]BCU89227.1 hypothetical protein YP72344_07220 [Yersinia pseudotuberculosis]